MVSIIKDYSLIAKSYPKLSISNKNELYSISGEIDIFDKEFNYYDSYEIVIEIHSGYPYTFPKLFEMGGKIPQNEIRHINDDGSCCVCVDQIIAINTAKGITLEEYMTKFVIPFFSNQYIYEFKKEWANGDYKHGIMGVIQFYIEETNLNLKEVCSLLKMVIDNDLPSRNKVCFCNSNLKFKHCHLNKLSNIRLIPLRMLKEHFVLLYNHVNSIQVIGN